MFTAFFFYYAKNYDFGNRVTCVEWHTRCTNNSYDLKYFILFFIKKKCSKKKMKEGKKGICEATQDCFRIFKNTLNHSCLAVSSLDGHLFKKTAVFSRLFEVKPKTSSNSFVTESSVFALAPNSGGVCKYVCVCCCRWTLPYGEGVFASWRSAVIIREKSDMKNEVCNTPQLILEVFTTAAQHLTSVTAYGSTRFLRSFGGTDSSRFKIWPLLKCCWII